MRGFIGILFYAKMYDADADDGLHTLLLYCVKVESVLNSTP